MRRHISRRRFIGASAASLITAFGRAAGAGAFPKIQAKRRPNILFLMADEFRHDCLGVAGNSIVKTPNLDRLAAGSVRFTEAYAASPVCSPSRAVLFTGRYPQINGVVGNGMALNPGEVALPEILKAYGYRTYMVGKLHLPPDHWFDEALITAGGRGREYREFLRKERPDFHGISNTAAIPDTLIRYHSPCPGHSPFGPVRIGTSVLPDRLYEEAWVADRAIDFLHRLRDSRQPWFLFVSVLKPHSEYVIPEPYATMYSPEKVPLPDSFNPGAKCTEPPEPDGNPRLFINDPHVMREIIAHYYGAVNMVDHHMGRVLTALQELGLQDETIVLFTSDHGNMLGERNRLFKGVMYEGAARVPLMLRQPRLLPRSAVREGIFDNSAVMPTLLDLAGIPIAAGIQGRSLKALARGEAREWPNTAYSVLYQRMVRRDHWKLIDPYKLKNTGSELYDLKSDPEEKHNLFGEPQLAEVQRSLEGKLQAWWNQKPPTVKLFGTAKATRG